MGTASEHHPTARRRRKKVLQSMASSKTRLLAQFRGHKLLGQYCKSDASSESLSSGVKTVPPIERVLLRCVRPWIRYNEGLSLQGHRLRRAARTLSA